MARYEAEVFVDEVVYLLSFTAALALPVDVDRTERVRHASDCVQ